MILIEGVKGIGKSTRYKGVKLKKRELYKKLGSDLVIDRMFLKEYVYANKVMIDVILQVQVFDTIFILIPEDISEYITKIKIRMIFDASFRNKMLTNLDLFNKTNKNKNHTMNEFLLEQISRYIKILLSLKSSYTIVQNIIVTNQSVRLFKCYKN